MRDRMQFTDRVVVVTGAGGGIGRQHALFFAARGARVVVNDVSAGVSGEEESVDRAGLVVAEIEQAGGIAVANSSSVSDRAGGEELIRAATDAFGRVDVVVNNAGILTQWPFDELSGESVDEMLGVHVGGAFNVTIPAWRVMKEQGYGRIVFTASNSGWIGTQDMAHYGAAKMALVGLTKCLAIEGAPFGITANAVAPVAVSRMQGVVRKSSSGSLLSEEQRAEYLGPERVSPVVGWLAHESTHVTGELFSVVGPTVSRVFLGLTEGLVVDPLTPEAIRDAAETLMDTGSFLVPTTIGDEIGRLADRLGRLASETA
jgi:NAD(P)-dependent dehydrogenase (short-subunit alcohol dehydrogenase family)